MTATNTASTIALDKGIPLPSRTNRATSKYPLDGMEVGDSFFIPNAKKGTQISVSKSMKARKMVCTTRAVTENEVAGIRVWRLADKAEGAAE